MTTTINPHRLNDLAPRMARELVRMADALDEDEESALLWRVIDPEGTTQAIVDDLLELGASGEPVNIQSVTTDQAKVMVSDVMTVMRKILDDRDTPPYVVSVQDFNSLMDALRQVKRVIAQGGGYKIFTGVLRRER